MHVKNKVLVISEGPPPLGDTFAEGGALRAWGLSKGLAYNGWAVTFVYRSTFEIGSYNKVDIPPGITVTTWDGGTINGLLHENKIVVVRYAMGEADTIVNKLSQEHILVSDSYIPISVEVSARNSSDPNEQLNFLRLQSSSKNAMMRADYILYASPTQKNYYLGYLSGINKLNPTTYHKLSERLFEVPYGIDPTDKPARHSRKKGCTLLWYGAFYSWFDMESLIPSLLNIVKDNKDFKFLVAGAKNPYNQDPGLLAHYKKTMEALSVLKDNIEFIDWHPYDKRFEIYDRADAIITLNHLGLENELAWRTRLMDYVLAHKPLLTNGGDPLGEDLISRGIAYRFDPSDLDTVFKKVISSEINKHIFEDASERYSWVNITTSLSVALQDPSRLINGLTTFKKTSAKQITRKIIKKIVHTPRYVKEHGMKSSIKHLRKKI